MTHSTTFVDKTTVITADWLNDVNATVFTALADGSHNPPTTAAQVASNIGAVTSSTLAAYAPLASPTFTGTPTLPSGTIATTQTVGDSSTKVATTAFVNAAAGGGITLAGNNAWTGTNTFVTQTAGDNSTKAATTAFVLENLPNSTIQPIAASVGANALTCSLGTTTLAVRSVTLTSGTITSLYNSSASVVIPSGATLGTTSSVLARLILLAINNAGTIELAIVNNTGGNNLDETILINTTTISSGASSASTIYSTTGRNGVPFRVVGFVDIIEGTAGTWATGPVLVQGAGGSALTAMSSIGYGQTWQNLTASRAKAVLYYNTTGRPIQLSIEVAQGGEGEQCFLTINNLEVARQAAAASGKLTLYGIVPPGQSYRIDQDGTTTLNLWNELR